MTSLDRLRIDDRVAIVTRASSGITLPVEGGMLTS
jgi:hypothetical protein